MDSKYPDRVYKKGDRVCYIESGLSIECVVLKSYRYNVCVLFISTGKVIWISLNKLTHDKKYYRDKYLKELGI